MRVLLVEDEERLANTIAKGLRREGMAVEAAIARAMEAYGLQKESLGIPTDETRNLSPEERQAIRERKHYEEIA